jgi:hypothetical protein
LLRAVVAEVASLTHLGRGEQNQRKGQQDIEESRGKLIYKTEEQCANTGKNRSDVIILASRRILTNTIPHPNLVASSTTSPVKVSTKR